MEIALQPGGEQCACRIYGIKDVHSPDEFLPGEDDLETLSNISPIYMRCAACEQAIHDPDGPFSVVYCTAYFQALGERWAQQADQRAKLLEELHQIENVVGLAELGRIEELKEQIEALEYIS